MKIVFTILFIFFSLNVYAVNLEGYQNAQEVISTRKHEEAQLKNEQSTNKERFYPALNPNPEPGNNVNYPARLDHLPALQLHGYLDSASRSAGSPPSGGKGSTSGPSSSPSGNSRGTPDGNSKQPGNVRDASGAITYLDGTKFHSTPSSHSKSALDYPFQERQFLLTGHQEIENAEALLQKMNPHSSAYRRARCQFSFW